MKMSAWVIRNIKNKYYQVGESAKRPIKWISDMYSATLFDSEEEARNECRVMKLTGVVYKITI